MATTEAPPAPDVASHVLFGRARTLAFATIAVGMLLAALDSTIVSTALPTIVGDLGGGDHVSWVVTSYLLAQTVVTAVVGKMGDQFGRKRVFQTSVTIFIIGSALCGLATNMGWLIGSRAIQGVGAGGLTVTATALIADVIPLRERGRYQGSLGAVFGVTTVLGPLLGGYFTDNLSWRWAFYINVPFALLVILAAGRTMPSVRGQGHPKIDYAGMAAVGGGASALILATSWGGTTHPWGSPTIIGLIVGGIALLVGFVVVERRAAEPILPMWLFTRKVFAVCCALSFVVGFTMLGAITFLPTFMQYVDGVSATISGLRTLPLVLGLLLTAIASGNVVSRTGRYKAFPVVGSVVMAVGLFLLSRMDSSTPVALSSLYMFVLGLGIGLSMQVLTIIVQNSVPYTELGVATSGVTFFRTMGSAFGAAIFGTLYANFLADRLPAAVAQSPGVTATDLATPSALHALDPKLIAPIVEAYSSALQHVFLWASPVALVALALALALPQVRLSDNLQPSAMDLSDGFGMPESLHNDEFIARRAANLLYTRGREGLLEMLDQADLGMDEGRVWALAQVYGLNCSARPASVLRIARAHRVPSVLLRPAFEDLAGRGLVVGPEDDLTLTAEGGAVVDHLGEVFRNWIIANLDDVDEADAPAVDAVIGRVAQRLVLEGAEGRELVTVGDGTPAGPT
jgi:EmrB/QacA subfamily drug resistance transporter